MIKSPRIDCVRFSWLLWSKKKYVANGTVLAPNGSLTHAFAYGATEAKARAKCRAKLESLTGQSLPPTDH